MIKAPNLEPRVITPELRKRMNRAGMIFFIFALILIGFLTNNFTEQYDPAHRAKMDKEAAEIKAAKKAAAQQSAQQAGQANQPIPSPPAQKAP
ncbi:MAG: hypothetical protein H7834_02715 [Magnetococcus sp. YQC-9]